MGSFINQIRRLSRTIISGPDRDSTTSNQFPGAVDPPNYPALQSVSHSDSSSHTPGSFQSSSSSITRPNSYISENSSRTKASNGPPADRVCGQSSPLAPRLINIAPNSEAHQRVLLLRGIVGENPDTNPLDGNVTIINQNNTPPTRWPVSGSHFKALVHLQPGPNTIIMTFESSSSRIKGTHQSWLIINYTIPESAHPLQLVILRAKDSPDTFDCPPSRAQREGNNLEVAIKKFRMCAYLWQAYTADQMLHNGFGRRSFRFDESWQPGTLFAQDVKDGIMRSQATVQVITMNKTVQEIRNLEYAQQYGPAKDKNKLYDFAMEAIRSKLRLPRGQPIYVSALFLDSKWDPEVGVIRGHAALGGAGGSINLGIFGSHCLYSYPSNLDEVPGAFTDCTQADTKYVANDNNQAGSSWEAANIGIGAHMHETGHLFGCPHQESGVMLRDYTKLHRSFVARESYSTARKAQGKTCNKISEECSWHRLDILRFRFHPCFRIPSDPTNALDKTVQAFPIPEDHSAILTAVSGICFIEVYTAGDEICRTWFDFFDAQAHYSTGSSSGSVGGVSPNGSVSSITSQHPPRTPAVNQSGFGLPTQVRLTEEMIKSKLPADKRKKRIRVVIHSAARTEACIKDFDAFIAKTQRIALAPNGSTKSLTKLASGVGAVSGCSATGSTDFAYPGLPIGLANMQNIESQTVLLRSIIPRSGYKSPLLLTSVRVWHGAALDGIEFVYDDGSANLFGRKNGTASEFKLNTRAAEVISGFHIRAGAWVDGIQIVTSTSRKSDFYGNKTGGQSYHVHPPRGFRVAGIRGDVGRWIGSVGIIVCR